MPSKMAGSQASSTSPDPGSATRLQRNLAEKQRRDKLNGYITELANIVPMVSMATKRLDKTSILRLSAAHLRIYQSSLNGRKRRSSRNSFKWRPNFLNSDLIQEVLEAVDGFLLVTISSGKIIYISQTVERFLGHQHIEMIGHSIFSFVHPADCDIVRGQLQKLTVASVHKKDGSSPRCSFSCRLRERNQPRSEVMTYQLVHMVGHMTDSENNEKNIDEEKDEGAGVSPSNFLFKAFVQVVHSSPYNDLPFVVEDEYVTRHSLDGTIIFADHRISTITGHLPHEVLGINAYHYIVKEDIPVALFAHKLMFSSSEGTGQVVYRLTTRDQGFVILRSTGYVHYELPNRVDHFACVNKLLSGDEGECEMRKFVECFTPHISGSSVNALYESIKSIQISGISNKRDASETTKEETNSSSDLNEENKSPLLKSLKTSDPSLIIKAEPCDQTPSADSYLMEVVSSDKHLQSSDSNVSSSDTVTSDCSQPQINFEAFNHHLSAKDRLSPDSDSTGQTYLCQSPLTDSSSSNRSYQSENTVALSPHVAANGSSSETSLLTNDSASSLPPTSATVSPKQVSSTQGPSEDNQSTLEHDVTSVFSGVASSLSSAPQANCFSQQSHLPPRNLWCVSPHGQTTSAQKCAPQETTSLHYSEGLNAHESHFTRWKVKDNSEVIAHSGFLYTSGKGTSHQECGEKSVPSSQDLTTPLEPMDDQPVDKLHIC